MGASLVRTCDEDQDPPGSLSIDVLGGSSMRVVLRAREVGAEGSCMERLVLWRDLLRRGEFYGWQWSREDSSHAEGSYQEQIRRPTTLRQKLSDSSCVQTPRVILTTQKNCTTYATSTTGFYYFGMLSEMLRNSTFVPSRIFISDNQHTSQSHGGLD